MSKTVIYAIRVVAALLVVGTVGSIENRPHRYVDRLLPGATRYHTLATYRVLD